MSRPRRLPAMRAAPLIALLTLCGLLQAPARAADPYRNDLTRTGDVLRVLLPAAAAGYSQWLRDDRDGANDYARIFICNELSVGLLKLAIPETRPRDSDLAEVPRRERTSFPSGHAASAFGAAFFIAERYGWAEAAPWLGAAAVVGYSRVDAKAHYWHDVLTSTAIAWGWAHTLTKPLAGTQAVLLPQITPQSVGLTLQTRF